MSPIDDCSSRSIYSANYDTAAIDSWSYNGSSRSLILNWRELLRSLVERIIIFQVPRIGCALNIYLLMIAFFLTYLWNLIEVILLWDRSRRIWCHWLVPIGRVVSRKWWLLMNILLLSIPLLSKNFLASDWIHRLVGIVD